MRRTVSGILVAAMVFAALAGGAQAGEKQTRFDGKTIAVIQKTLNNPFHVAVADTAKEVGESYGFTVQVHAPDFETEVDKQVSIMETVIEQGVDVIIAVPCSGAALVDTIVMAEKRGIPVFLVDSGGADAAPFVSFIGTNNFNGGQIAADWFGKNVKGEVAILDGFSGNDATTQRYKGFMDRIVQYPDITVVASEYGNCELSKGMEVTENFLTAYPDLRGIFACNDTMAIGAGQAVEAAGRRSEIKICGFDGQPDAATKILEGTIDATIAQKPATMGRLAIEKIIAHLNGEKVDRIIDTGCDVADKSNATTYLVWN